MLYLYAIIDQSLPRLPITAGLAGTRLFSLGYGDLAAIVSEVAAPLPQPTEANAWQHEAVIEAFMAQQTVLPVRFGTVFSSETAIKSILETHYSSLIADLQRLRHKVELGLRVLWPAQAEVPLSPPKVSGETAKTYLRARLALSQQAQAQHQEAEALAQRIHTPLAQLALEHTSQILLTPRLLLTAAYLLPQDQVSLFQQKVLESQELRPALQILSTGPWPAYNFIRVKLNE